jgi:hypothetical protein
MRDIRAGVLVLTAALLACTTACGGGGGGGGSTGASFTVASINPDAGFNGENTAVTISGTGFSSDPSAVFLLHPVTAVRIDLTGVARIGSTQIDAVVPLGGAAAIDKYDLHVTISGKTVKLASAFLVTDVLPPQVTGVTPPSGWDQKDVKITITGGNFISLPFVFLKLDAGAEVAAENVLFVDSGTLTAIVPAGLPVGAYDVIVQNPNGIRGSLLDGFLVSATSPPVIDDVTPTSTPAASAATFTITGEFFSQSPLPEAYLSNDPVNLKLVPLTVTGVTAPDLNNKQQISADYAGGSAIGTYVLTVFNPDGQWDTFASVKLASSAEGKLGDAGPFVDSGKNLDFARRRHGGALGRDDLENDFLYVVGGDDGTTALRSVEVSPLSLFGNLGTWRSSRRLASARTGLGLVEVKHPTTKTSWLFAIGGSSTLADSGALNTVERARVLTQATAPQNVSASVSAGGSLTANTAYYYRVSAVTAGGEEWLSSDIVSTRTTGGDLTVQLSWDAVTGASTYHVYRSQGRAGDERRIAEGVAVTSLADGGLPPIIYPTPDTVTVAEVGGGTLATGTWYYRVAAVTVNGEMAATPDKLITLSTPATARVDWTALTDQEVLHYNIYRSEAVNDATSNRYLIARKILSPPFDDTGLPLLLATGPASLTATALASINGTLASGTYNYVVTGVTPQYETLPSPTANVVVGGTDNAVSLSWPSVDGVDSYNVYRDDGAGGPLYLIRSGLLGTSLTDTGLVQDVSKTPGDGKIAPASGTFKPLRLGDLGRWTTLTLTLGTARHALSAVSGTRTEVTPNRTFLYALCGRDSLSALLDSVERAEVVVAGDDSLDLSGDGGTGAWFAEANPVAGGARAYAGAARADKKSHPNIAEPDNFYLYAVQGRGAVAALASVEGAKAASAAGELTLWNLNGFDPGQGKLGNSAALSNGFIYSIGGFNPVNAVTQTLRGTLGSDGSISLWADASASINTARGYHASTPGSSFLYVVGGQTSNEGAVPVTLTATVEQIPF